MGRRLIGKSADFESVARKSFGGSTPPGPVNRKARLVEVLVTTDPLQAQAAVKAGYIPVEASYGDKTAHDVTRAIPILTLDHHGPFSDLECPTVRAQKEFFNYGAGILPDIVRGRYVLSHVDADSFLTVMGLEGYKLPPTFVERVVFSDLYGPHKIPADQRNHPEQIKLSLLNDLLNNRKGFTEVEIRKAIQILQLPDNSSTIADKIRKLDARYARLAPSCFMLDDEEYTASVAIGVTEDYPMDILYDMADFAVAYHNKDRYITIGCRDLETGQAYAGWGEKGLIDFWPRLGPGWGGRETIGGSPRGELMTLQQAVDAAKTLKMWMGEKNGMERSGY